MAEDYADRYRDTSVETLRDIAAYWRRDAAARLHVAVGLYEDAKKKGDERAMADVYVRLLSPTLASLNAVEAGELLPRCGKCDRFIRPTDARQPFEGDGDGAIFSYVHGAPECRWHDDDIIPNDGDEYWEAFIDEARALMRAIDEDVPEEPEAVDG